MNEINDPMEQFDAARNRVAAIAAQARANRASASRLADEAKTVESSARSRNGEVTVSARAGGVISALVFSAEALELSAGELSKITVATIAQAQHEAASQLAERAAEELGADAALVEVMRVDADRAFPAPDGGLRY